jgi:hypothetical protein
VAIARTPNLLACFISLIHEAILSCLSMVEAKGLFYWSLLVECVHNSFCITYLFLQNSFKNRRYLRYLCLIAYSDVQSILCCVFLCLMNRTLCCLYLWIVHFWLSFRCSLTFIYKGTTTTITTINKKQKKLSTNHICLDTITDLTWQYNYKYINTVWQQRKLKYETFQTTTY